MEANKFHDRAVATLDSRSGKWHCILCWAIAADLRSPDDQQRLTKLALTFLSREDPAAKLGGTCDAGTHQAGGLLVRTLPRQRAAERR